MTQKYTSEQFWKLYKELPQELRSALSGEETGNNVYDICKKNGVAKHLDEIVENVGAVLLGLLLPNEFQDVLEKEMGLEKEIAKNIAKEIYRFVFYPVKTNLEELYKIEIAPIAKMKITPPPQQRPTAAPREDDTYREAIE